MTQPLIALADVDYVFNSPEQCGVSFSDMIEKHLPLENYANARALSGLAEPGYSSVYRSKAIKNLKKMIAPGLDTYYAIWENAVKNFGDRPALASRPYNYKTGVSEPRYTSITFKEADRKVQDFGAGLFHVLQHSPFKIPGCEPHEKIENHLRDYRSYTPENHSFIVTLYLGNREEWVIADLACSTYAISNTVLYDTLGANTSEYILLTTQSPVVITSYQHVEQVISLKENSPELAAIITIISMDPLDCESPEAGQSLVEMARAANIELFGMDQVIGIGKLFPMAPLPPTPESLYTISFTSGTTGASPKGVIMTHLNAALGICFVLCNAPSLPFDVEIVFLPLAHIYERQGLAHNLLKGGMCGFPQLNGTPLTLVEDLKLLKPKHMSNVPRVFTKLEAALKNATLKLDLAVKRALFAKVFDTKMKLQSVADGAKGEHWLYDHTIVPKLRKVLGFDEMLFCTTGLAPISPETVRFMKAALNIGFSQGYGLTETYAGFCFSQPFEKEPGSCGAPGVCCDIRVRELPELNYHIDDPRGPSGELLIRGHQVFPGYYKNKEETDKCLKDGWFATGDVARIDPANGRLFIIDRVKNFFKLAQGEYVTPEKVENVYLSSNPLLTQCFVHGDSLRHHLVAVVGVDPAGITNFLVHECNVSKADLHLEEAILQTVNKTENRIKLLKALNSRVSGLTGFELIHNLYVEFEPLRIERDVITPTVKIRRPIAAKFFAEQIKSMYEEPSLVSKTKM